MGVIMIILFFVILIVPVLLIIDKFENKKYSVLKQVVFSIIYIIILFTFISLILNGERRYSIDKYKEGKIKTIYTIYDNDTINVKYKVIE